MNPEPDDIDKLSHRLAENHHEISRLLAPLFDAADGVKNELERRGWSPTVSEELAAEYLVQGMRRLFTQLDRT